MLTGATLRAYSAYGSDSSSSQRAPRTAYAGEVAEADTGGCYLLGERAYSPTLRRFVAPDSASPFDGGGVNRYAYCGGDPINRIDPSGHTWLGWLGSSLGMRGTLGASRSVSPASASLHEASSTPDGTATTVATVADVVSVTAAVDAVASMAATDPKAGGLFGWVAIAGKLTTGGSALPPARIGTPAERFLGRQPALTRSGRGDGAPTPQVQVVMDQDIPAERLLINRFGAPYLARRWARRSHAQNSGSRIWAPDTAISADHFTNLFRNLASKGVTEVNVYTGAHGSPYGGNWHNVTGKRLNGDDQLFIEDFVHTRKAAESVGIRIKPINLGNMTRQQMQHRLMKSGVHIIGTCYGLSDDAVMEALNLSHVTVYKLTDPRP